MEFPGMAVEEVVNVSCVAYELNEGSVVVYDLPVQNEVRDGPGTLSRGDLTMYRLSRFHNVHTATRPRASGANDKLKSS